MPDFLQYIQEAPYETKRLTRGYNVDESTLSIGFSERPTPYDFGLSPKDSVEFAVYSTGGVKLAWKVVDDEPNYEVINLDYTNMSDERVGGQARVFTKNYPTIDGNVVVSPSIDARSLGIDSGSYYVRYSFVNDIVGSSANKSKLVIKDISTSRTELKVIPECLKTSNRPEDISLSFDYENFANKRLPVSHLYNFTDKLLKQTNILATEFDQSLADLLDNYEESMALAMGVLGNTDRRQVFIEIDSIRKRVFTLYENTLLSEYNEVYTRTDFYIQYINSINFEISKQKRFADSDVSPAVVDLYKSALIVLFDSDYLNNLFVDRFEMYFNNYINLGTAETYPILSVGSANENVSDEEKHTPMIIKLAEPLPQTVEVGNRLYISNKLYSDDVVQKVTYYQKIKSNLTKLRGPDRGVVVGNSGTKEYSKDELQEESGTSDVDADTLAMSSYFNSNINKGMTKFDEFSDFVKFSSAKSQLDIFIQKFSKISKLINTIISYEYSIEVIDKKIEDNKLPDDPTSRGSIAILQGIDLKEKLNELDSELLMLSDYERFLFYETSPRAYPRSSNIYVTKITGTNRLANGRYVEYGYFNDKNSYKHWLSDWYLWWDAQKYQWVLSDRVYSRGGAYFAVKSETYFYEVEAKWSDVSGFEDDVMLKISQELIEYGPEKGNPAPEYITDDVSAWSRDSLGYKWYIDMATEAAYYDKSNDDFLALNIPEFLIRDDANEDFTKLLSAIGLTFDTIDGYIKNMGNSRAVRNDPNKGVSDELVYYFLNAYGMGLTGKNTRTDPSSKLKLKDENSAEFQRTQIWRRILNNMAYILKTKGTKEAVEALMRCYDIPEQLFVTREYGGASNEDSSTKFSEFTFDTYDYRLSITEEDEYIQVPWNYNGLKPKALELKLYINTEASTDKPTRQVSNATDTVENILSYESTPIVECGQWSFGLKRDTTDDEGWWRFYITTDGPIVKGGTDEQQYETLIPSSEKPPLYINHKDGYDILIQVSDRYKGLRRKMLTILVKRHSDGELVVEESAEVLVDELTYLNFSLAPDLFIGNNTGSGFAGEVDRLRIYTEEIEEEDFNQHIKFGQSYSLRASNKSVEDTLIFKTNFDYPHDISYESNYQLGYGIIPNSSLKDSHSESLKCYNFKKVEYPYNFVGNYKKEYAELPSFGAQIFNNKKVRIEEQETTANLTPLNRVTKRSLDRVGVDTNKLGVFFGKGVSLNEEIIKFFGKIKLGDYIGNPEDYNKKEYKELNKLRKLFFKHGFGKVDWYDYINQLKGYFDESFFENLEKLVPGRTTLTSGLLIEPLLLERPKTKGAELSTSIESNVDRIQIIEPTEKIKPLRNIRLSAKTTNKDIIQFANAPVYGDRKTDSNVTCLSSGFLYKRIEGTSYQTDLFANVDYSYLTGICSNFGHTTFDGKTYRVEREDFELSHSSKFSSGLVDYTIANKVSLEINITETMTSVSDHFSTASGEYLSDRNLNGTRLFINSAGTWFVYFEPYIDRWVLMNTDPRKISDTYELIPGGEVRRMYSTTSGHTFPIGFGVNAYTEVTSVLSGNYEAWDDMFTTQGSSGSTPLRTNREYRATSKVKILNDKFINISGTVLGVLECEVSGSFNGTYNEVEDSGEVVVHPKGSYLFRGHKKTLKLHGHFTGTLANGFVGSPETQSEFVVQNGYVNAERFGGCYFSDKKMYGDINDIVEDDLRYTNLNLEIFDSTKLNKTSKHFKNIKLVPVPNKVEYDIINEDVNIKKKVNIERNSTNKVFYDESGTRSRKTLGTYTNCFYHKTRDEIVPALFHNVGLELKTKLKTNHIRGVQMIGYSTAMALTSTQQNFSYTRKFKTQVIKNETYTINLAFNFYYKLETDTYKVEPEIYSRGRELNENSYYSIKYDQYGDSLSEKKNFWEAEVWTNLDDIYDQTDVEFVMSKSDVQTEFRTTRCSLFSLDIDENHKVYFLANLDEHITADSGFHSLDYVDSSTETMHSGGIETLNTDDVFSRLGVSYAKMKSEMEVGINYDKIEVKHNRHHKIHNNVKVGDTIRLDIYGKKKTKYSLQVNRELTPDEVDDSEAVVFTKETLGCHVIYDIKEKFLRYEASIDSLKYHSYYTAESPSNYFLLLPKSEYMGFSLDGFVGRWKSANGKYLMSYRINEKHTYLNENGTWLVFWSTETPRCNKQNLKGAWVLVKVNPVEFPSLIQSELSSESTSLWMYGFIPSEFNSEVSYDASPYINTTVFSTDYGCGNSATDIKYEALVSYVKNLCNDTTYITNQLKQRTDNSIDTSFVVIPNKLAFEFAEKHGRNTLGVKDQILSWVLNISSVESKLPARGLYDKIKPNRDVDVQLEVDYIQHYDRTTPVVRVVGADVRTSEFLMTEGEYYPTSTEYSGYPVYRNQNGFLIRRDKYMDEKSDVGYVWTVSQDNQPINTKSEDLLDKKRLVFVSTNGSCTSDDFNFRVGYDMNPNIDTTQDRKDMLAGAFEDAVLLKSSDEIIPWGYNRNENACSVCEDISTPDFSIDVTPDDIYTTYSGKKNWIAMYQGTVDATIECNQLSCPPEVTKYVGTYALTDNVYCDSLICYDQTEGIAKLKKTESGWILEADISGTGGDYTSYISSNNLNVVEAGTHHQHPKYGMYISDSAEYSFIYYEKNEYSEIQICVNSNNTDLHPKFKKTNYIRNNRPVYENENEWFIFYNKEEVSGDEYWCISDTMSDRNIKYKADVRWADERNHSEGDRHYDEEFGVYYKKTDTIDFNEQTALVVNMKINLNTDNFGNTWELDKYDTSSFSYRVTYDGVRKIEGNILEIVPIMSSIENKFISEIPLSVNYKPEMFYKDYPKLIDVEFSTSGSYEYNTTEKIPVDITIKSLGQIKKFEFDIGLKNSFSRLEEYTEKSFSVSFKNNPSNEELEVGYIAIDPMYEKYYVNEIEYELGVSVKTSRDPIVVIDNVFKVDQETDFSELFADESDESERNIVIDFTENLNYKIDKHYSLTDVKKVRVNNDLITRGRSKEHISYKKRYHRSKSVNHVNSTVGYESGVRDFTSPIIRTRRVYPRTGYQSGASDSFWFTDETPVTRLPKQEPVVVRKGVYDLPAETLDKMEFYYSFNNTDAEFVEDLESPTPSPTISPTDTSSPTPTDD